MTESRQSHKIVLLGDCHFGARGDSEFFKEHQRAYFTNFFFPFLEENNVDTVIQLGDLFDRRKNQNIKTLYDVRNFFFDEFEKRNISLISFLGNHDVYYNNRNYVNAPREILSNRYENITIYEEPTELVFGNTKFALIPWINRENSDDSINFIRNSTADVVLGHFEITGFKMMKGGIECEDGLSQKEFDPFTYTFSGHFHHPAKNGNIIYIGSSNEITWADAEDTKGFVLFDTENKDYEWIKSPYYLHKKIYYNDEDLTFEKINSMDFSYYDGKKVKVIVEQKSDEKLFEHYMSKLNNVFDIQISDSTTSQNFHMDVEDAEDTLTTIKKNIASIEDNRIDSKKLENLTESIYFEALNLSKE